MRAIIAATGTGIGKTYVTCGLIRALRAIGQTPLVLKPVLSGFSPADAALSDAGQILAALGQPLTPAALAAIAPFRYAAPLSPDWAAEIEGGSVDFASVLAVCRTALATPGGLLIETAGGILSPLTAETTMADLLVALGLPVVLVTGSYLGTFSHTLSAAESLTARGLAFTVVVSESPPGAEPAPDFPETLARLHHRLGRPVHALPRLPAAQAAPLFANLLGAIPAAARACAASLPQSRN